MRAEVFTAAELLDQRGSFLQKLYIKHSFLLPGIVLVLCLVLSQLHNYKLHFNETQVRTKHAKQSFMPGFSVLKSSYFMVNLPDGKQCLCSVSLAIVYV